MVELSTVGTFAGIIVAILAILRFFGITPKTVWKRYRKCHEIEPTWADFVDDVRSLDAAGEVYPNEEKWRMEVEYPLSEEQFHRQTKYEYKILDSIPNHLMVEPLR